MKALVAAASLLALAVSMSSAQTALPGKGAGPRLGAITRVEIQISSREDLDRLTREGYDVAGVQGDRVSIFADAEELAALRAEGWNLKIRELPTAPGPGLLGLGEYNNYTNLTAMLDNYAAEYPAICRKTSLGRSVRGRELWALKITSNPDVETEKPEVRLLFTMHGNEFEATELSLYFIDHLLRGYTTNDTRVVRLVENLEIWIVPLMNPDGRESRPAARYNANGYDLNRSFPDGALPSQWLGNRLYGPAMRTNGLQAEVRHVMTWTATRNFTLAANFHTGATLVSYSYGNDNLGNVYSPTPDDGFARAVSLSYASNNPVMWAFTDRGSRITNGVVRGAEWYATPGCIDDWGYRFNGYIEICMELTTYQGAMPVSQLPSLWAQNREPMLILLERALKGVRGIVRDAATGEPVTAAVRVEGIHHLVFTDGRVGDYHRLLLPGAYNLWFYAPGYMARRIEGVTVGDGEATRLDVALQPVNSRFAAKINFQPASTNIPAGFLPDTGGVFGARDGGYSYGWETDLGQTNAAVRKAGRSQDLRYDTLGWMQAGANHVWEIAVPNGPCSVLIAAGDPSNRTNYYEIYAEGTPFLTGLVWLTNRLDCNRWIESLGSVIVTDGRLTLSNGPNATNNLLAFVEVSALEPATIAEWRARYFASTTGAGDAANDADPDHDRVPNLLEYAFGLDPAQPDPASQLIAALLPIDGTNQFACGFTRNTNATDISFTIEATTELSNPTWAELASYTPGTGWSGPARVAEAPAESNRSRVTIIDPQPVDVRSSRFVRFRVSPQLSP